MSRFTLFSRTFSPLRKMSSRIWILPSYVRRFIIFSIHGSAQGTDVGIYVHDKAFGSSEGTSFWRLPKSLTFPSVSKRWSFKTFIFFESSPEEATSRRILKVRTFFWTTYTTALSFSYTVLKVYLKLMFTLRKFAALFT